MVSGKGNHVMRAGVLTIVLACSWLLWSGHWHEPFLLGLGVLSCLFVLVCCIRLRILDEESVPMHWGLRPFYIYVPWLVGQVVVSNIDVIRRILNPHLPIRPRMLWVPVQDLTELGQVVLANSITLTPGTVTVEMDSHHVLVHALAWEGTEQELTHAMESRIRHFEGQR